MHCRASSTHLRMSSGKSGGGQVDGSSCKSLSAAQTSVESSRALLGYYSFPAVPVYPYLHATAAFLAKTIVFPIGFQWCPFLTFSAQARGNSATINAVVAAERNPIRSSTGRFRCWLSSVVVLLNINQPERRLGKWSIFSIWDTQSNTLGSIRACPTWSVFIPKLETTKIQRTPRRLFQAFLNCLSIPVESPSYSLTIKCCNYFRKRLIAAAKKISIFALVSRAHRKI